MIRMTASEARRNWFRLLDQVLEGEVVTILRHGRRIVLRLEETPDETAASEGGYGDLLQVPDLDQADTWSWSWDGPEDELRSIDESS